jgi:glutamate-1-semialdehyde 2,1-aminomutase
MRKPYTFTKSKKLWVRAQKLIASGSQITRHPLYPEFPIYFDRCKGCRMWDVDGNEFIDLLCSIGPIILGYAYGRVDRAVRSVLATSFQSSMNHPIQLELAELLIDAIPSAERVRFLKTGTEATVAAVRLARYITGRTWVARHGYHGWADIWWHGFTGGVPKAAWEVVPPFDGTAEGLARLLRKSRKPFAAVILCPADTRPFTRANYQGIVDVAHKHGALVIFDEVKSGFRMALGGAQEVLGVTPDLTTISKGMANGYPLSALVGKAEYMQRMNEARVAGTFSVEALALAASVATIKELKERNVPAHLARVGQRLIDGLNAICHAHGVEGPLAYPDPVPAMPRFTWKPYTDDFTHPAHKCFFAECHRYGLFFADWHVTFVNYSHKDRDIDEALGICDLAMARTKRKFYR